MQRSMRPALHALANEWVRAAEDTAYRKAVSLKPAQEKDYERVGARKAK